MKNFLFTLFLASLILSPSSALQLDVHDSVLESGRYGTDVVLLSVVIFNRPQYLPIIANCCKESLTLKHKMDQTERLLRKV